MGNYIGPDNGHGIWIYFDGVETGSDTSRSSTSYGQGDGRIVIGRQFTNTDNSYASVELDELMLFNAKLSDPEITILRKF